MLDFLFGLSTIEAFWLVWVLPALTVFLVYVHDVRRDYKHGIEDWKVRDWIGGLIVSVFYPAGFVLIFVFVIWPWLIKERSIDIPGGD